MSIRALVSEVDRPDWIEGGATALQDGVHQAYDALGPSRRPVMDFWHGTWTGHPLHPILTDVTIGMWMATAVFDVLGATTGDRGSGRHEHITEGEVNAARRRYAQTPVALSRAM